MLAELKNQDDIVDGEGAPLPGSIYQCAHCWTRIRTGQPHRAVEPYPHATLEALIVKE